MDILAIDLGTKTGYAYNRGFQFFAGTWELAKPKEVTAWGKQRLNRRKDPRIDRLCDLVGNLGVFDTLLFEDVQFASSQYQAHLWAGLRSSLWLCGGAAIFDTVPTGTLKLFATGNGAATKEAMSAALKRQRLELWKPGHDDNAIDAIWLHLWAQKNLTRLQPSTILSK